MLTESKDGTINISFSGGTPPVTIEWEGRDTESFMRAGLSQGIYSFEVPDANNCSYSDRFELKALRAGFKPELKIFPNPIVLNDILQIEVLTAME